jgi:hypothetical protein
VHIIISWIGKLYVRAEILRSGNDTLLNNLKEGVFVIEETKEKIHFINEAGDTILKKNDFQSMTHLEEAGIDRKQKRFALLEK